MAQVRPERKRRAALAKAVERELESESDDGVMGDEFEGLSEEVESEEEVGVDDGFVVDTEKGGVRPGFGSDASEDSMEGSRSRSEEDLRDIGSARRLDDDDTGDSAWKDAAEGLAADDAGPSERLELEKESGDDVGVALGLEEEDDSMEVNEEEEGEEGGSEDQPSGSVSLVDSSDSDTGSGGKGENATSSAYSRAFSKILKQSKAAKESETGPVLAARQTLVARKLEEEAGETKENKVAKKEKKELREKAHVYPQTFTDTKEKDLVKLATRGVVKLFNAVSKAQKVQATSEARDAKVVAKQSKSAFLAEVRGTGTSAAVGTKRSLSSASTPPFKFGTSESQNQPFSRWSVVRNDFMLGKQKLKDWDKDEEMGDAAGVQIDNDSD